MTCDSVSSKNIRDFSFSFVDGNKECLLTVPIDVSSHASVGETVQHIIQHHNIPPYLETELFDNLKQFIEDENTKRLDEIADRELLKVKEGIVDIDDIVKSWSNAFRQEVLCYAGPEPCTNERLFSEAYNSLVHSSAVETLLNLEHSYALAMEAVLEQRNQDLNNLHKRQQEEMEDAMKHLSVSLTDDDISRLVQKHFENVQLAEGRWASELSMLRFTQRQEYRDWVMSVHEDLLKNNSTDNKRSFAPPAHISGTSRQHPEHISSSATTRREESFTVHLGAQLKTTHNLRLLRADVLDLCRHKSFSNGGRASSTFHPQRFQIAISLYSNNLSGLVLLVDNRPNSYMGIKKEFAEACERSTDFHFPTLEQQFEKIVCCAQEKNKQSAKETSNNSIQPSAAETSVRLNIGDFYITRHSNLSEVHVVFHLVVDDGSGMSATSCDVSSRHPIILGYRNILKACFRYDIRTITFPLLLVHEMSEEMTIPWCLKRAELVMKCVKGFIMELVLWSGQEMYNIQFLIPKALSDETFDAISDMMPAIFQMSNPVVAK